ncbi:MAG TPA: SDR family oxidoreductase [Flavisolibacter sp.]
MNDKTPQRNRTIVITGASSGAGRATALEFAKSGARLVLAARNEEALQELATECESLGAKALVSITDTGVASDVYRLAETAVAFGGGVDIWVNNAGVLAAGAFEKIPMDVNEAVIRTNLLGYIHGAHAVLPYFKDQGFGMIINNISVGGLFPTPYMSAYCASKFGLRGFFDALRGELVPFRNIHVCDLYPAFLDTPGIQHAANYTGKVLKPAPPLSDPREIARAIVALSDYPKAKSAVGVFPHFLKASYTLFPALSRTVTGAVMRTYLKAADEAEGGSGNVLDTVRYGNSIDGGWRPVVPNVIPRKGAMLLAGLALAGIALLRGK